MFIYKITNRTNGKVYVGQTVQTLEQRWRRHCRVNSRMAICQAIREFGPDGFTVEVLEEVATLAELNDRERYFISILRSYDPEVGYNRTRGGASRRPSPSKPSDSVRSQRPKTVPLTPSELRRKAHLVARNQARTKPKISRYCLQCPTVFQTTASVNKQFCSRACSNRHKTTAATGVRRDPKVGAKVSATKRQRGNPLKGRKLTQDVRNRMSKAQEFRKIAREERGCLHCPQVFTVKANSPQQFCNRTCANRYWNATRVGKARDPEAARKTAESLRRRADRIRASK